MSQFGFNSNHKSPLETSGASAASSTITRGLSRHIGRLGSAAAPGGTVAVSHQVTPEDSAMAIQPRRRGLLEGALAALLAPFASTLLGPHRGRQAQLRVARQRLGISPVRLPAERPVRPQCHARALQGGSRPPCSTCWEATCTSPCWTSSTCARCWTRGTSPCWRWRCTSASGTRPRPAARIGAALHQPLIQPLAGSMVRPPRRWPHRMRRPHRWRHLLQPA